MPKTKSQFHAEIYLRRTEKAKDWRDLIQLPGTQMPTVDRTGNITVKQAKALVNSIDNAFGQCSTAPIIMEINSRLNHLLTEILNNVYKEKGTVSAEFDVHECLGRRALYFKLNQHIGHSIAWNITSPFRQTEYNVPEFREIVLANEFDLVYFTNRQTGRLVDKKNDIEIHLR